MKKLAALLSAAALIFCSSAWSYQITAPYKSAHFALYQVVLDAHERFDDSLRFEITRELQTQNRLNKSYQSSAMIFPYGSQGLKGTIGTEALGLISISNYATGNDQIVFNPNAKSASYAGLYFSFDLLTQFADNKMLNPLMQELLSLPLAVTDIPVSAAGFDSKGNFYVTARHGAILLDLRLDDSVYYTRQDIYSLKGRKNCTIDALIFTERAAADLPLFISARAAVNNISCPDMKAAAPHEGAAD